MSDLLNEERRQVLIRLPVRLIKALDHWAIDDNVRSRAELIERLLEAAVTQRLIASAEKFVAGRAVDD